ncbi:MAG: Gfo/Idh/MocA family protein [Gemmataceae bacterium]
MERRAFLQTAASTAALAAGARVLGANERFNVAVIGCGGMGSHHLGRLLNNDMVDVAYVCDVDENRLAKAAKAATDRNKQTKPVKDLRNILDDKKIDAVWIATPDHWHAPAAILALNAGKHVYVEKPCAHNIREGRLMIEAARNNKRTCQVGTQSRSTAHLLKAMEILNKGTIGDILVAKAWNSQKRANIGHAKPVPVPPNLDYELWVGPAPLVPFQPNRSHYTWHWWYDFGTGDMGNDGVHNIDIARWGLGVDKHPSTISGTGHKLFFDDDQQFADTQYIVFDYPGDGKFGARRQLIYEQRIWSPYMQEGFENGDAFYGTKGVMLLGQTGMKLYGADNKLIEEAKGAPSVPDHHANFFECIKSGNRPNADIEINHLSSSLCHLGNIASRLGRALRFDPAKEQFVDDSEANALVGRKYREHWATPKGA